MNQLLVSKNKAGGCQNLAHPISAAIVGVADGNGQRVGGVVALEFGLGHQDLQHHVDLLLLAMADANHCLLHRVRCIFRDPQARARRHQHGNATGLPELQGGDGVLVDEGLLDRRLVRLVGMHDFRQAVVQLAEPGRQIHVSVGGDGAGGDEAQRVAQRLDDAPAAAAEARVNADNSNRVLHGVTLASRLPVCQN